MARVAGAVGIEPTYDGIKTRCLTAWLRPNLYCAGVKAVGSRSRSDDCGAPVVYREPQLQLAVREVDSARHEQTVRGAREWRELIRRVSDAPEPLLERRERAV